MDDVIEKLKRLSDHKLVDVVKNYKQYGYDDSIRDAAMNILKEHGYSEGQLKFSGNYENQVYNDAAELYKIFTRDSNITFTLYFIMLFFKLLSSIIKTYSPVVLISLSIITWILLIAYFIFFVKSFLDQSRFYKLIGKDYGAEGAILYFFLGMPLYLFMYFFFKHQMNQEMRLIK